MGIVDELKGVIAGFVFLILLGFTLVYMVVREILKMLLKPWSQVSVGNFDALFTAYFFGTLFVVFLWMGLGSNSSGDRNGNG